MKGRNIMEKVPTIISTKDLSYICDMFNWNFTMAKKALCYSKEVNDEEISNEFNSIYYFQSNYYIFQKPKINC